MGSGATLEPGGPFAAAALAASYEDWYGTPWGRLADELETALILELLAPLGPGATLLDVGCGTGHFAAALAARGWRVTGVDPAAAMLARARQRVPVARADGLHLPFADGSFDGALCVSVLEFTPDPAALLRELRRVARARVAVLTLNARSYLGLRRRLAGWKGHPLFRAVRPLTRRELLAAVRAAGTEVERVRTVLHLPPALAGRFPALERRRSSADLPLGGILGVSVPGRAGGLTGLVQA